MSLTRADSLNCIGMFPPLFFSFLFPSVLDGSSTRCNDRVDGRCSPTRLVGNYPDDEYGGYIRYIGT